jgi:hypothetical protein
MTTMILLLVACFCQGEDLAKLAERGEKLEKIPSMEALLQEAKDLVDQLNAALQKNPQALQAHEILAGVYQTVGKRYLLANDLTHADEQYLLSIKTSKELVDKVAALIAAAKEDPDRSLEQKSLFAGYYYIVAIHDRAFALKSDPARRAELEKQVAELETFFKDYFNNHDTYFLALDGATYLGHCYQFLAELSVDRYSVADQYWSKCFNWLAKGRDVLNLRDMREEGDAHQVAARAVLHEIQARMAYSKQLKAAAGPWERQLIYAVNTAESLLSLVPPLRKTAMGQKIQAEADSAKKALEE